MCGFGYKDYETTERCENYCAENQSCSIEITKNAVYIPDPPLMTDSKITCYPHACKLIFSQSARACSDPYTGDYSIATVFVLSQ